MRAVACTPKTVVRSGSRLIAARGLPLPPWLTRSSYWLFTDPVTLTVVEPAGAQPLVAGEEQIEREIAQVGDEVAVAAEQLIVALAVVPGGRADTTRRT